MCRMEGDGKKGDGKEGDVEEKDKEGLKENMWK